MIYNRKNFTSRNKFSRLNFFFVVSVSTVNRNGYVCISTTASRKEKEREEKKMSIRPIDANTNKTRSSYLGAAALGVLTGNFAKYAIPVSKQEYDTFVTQTLKKGYKRLSKDNVTAMVKASRSTFDFAVVASLVFMSAAFLKNMHNKLANK